MGQTFEEIPPKYVNSIEKANGAIKLKTGSASSLYLLLDSRKWKPEQSFARFISAIFYVGQGSSVRWRDHILYSVLFEDYKELIGALDLNCSKEKIILKIWKSGNPVYVIKVMDSRTQAAVKFGEFAIIETIRTLSLANKIRGHTKSVPVGFSGQDVILYGTALLSKVHVEKTTPIAMFKDSFNTKQYTPSWAPTWFCQVAEKSDIRLLQTLPVEKLAYLFVSLSKCSSVKSLKGVVVEDIVENGDIGELVRQLKDRFGQSVATRLKTEDPIAYEAHLKSERKRDNARYAKIKADPIAYQAELEKSRLSHKNRYAKRKADPIAYQDHLKSERERDNTRNAKARGNKVAHEARLKKRREKYKSKKANN